MAESLSVVLPVYNAESILVSRVEEVLDTIAELTSEIELLIVDDGSTDQTEEAALELARRFPQIRYVRQPRRQGIMLAAKTGIQTTDGDTVMIHDIESPLSSVALQELWSMRNDSELVFARSQAPDCLVSDIRRQRGVTAWRGTQMLRRRAVSELRAEKAKKRTVTIDRITRTDLATQVPTFSPNSLQLIADTTDAR